MSDNEVAELFGLKPEETTPKLEAKKPAPQETTELPLPPPPPNFKSTKTKPASKIYGTKEATGWIVASIEAGVVIIFLLKIIIG